ncbi:TPR repeat-containing protein DDB_G0287407-like [Dreissena polymorpha]|uniref:NACHT domain-containing protein n=1 Tax=Dreissena polymorpha TaxID=45954 RepID=A0A9D4QZD1_DREPO|nr:TPR repeat-containing protein DDB_G0287407-like [Dreissena polymorpha]XP_052274314.1 TPR repeat-containing protein DDB_G0287407-like [Dreissena polymorpha]KAH3849179.1 hypothetical protein DPMN_091575 [Dreissena polymorpha]
MATGTSTTSSTESAGTGGATAASGESDDKPPLEGSVKLYITSYTDDFFAEREFFRREILPNLKSWCEAKHLALSERYVKWGSIYPDRREASTQEKIQTSIENCYHHNNMPIFLNFTSEGVGWVPMWGECPDEYVEEFIQAYGLLPEDIQVMSGAYREDNHNSLFLIRSDVILDKIPDLEKKYFLQRTSASDKIKQNGDMVTQKFPPARLIKYNCKYMGLDARKHAKLAFQDSLGPTILDFCKQRILFDFCGEQPQSFNKQDNQVSLEHETFKTQKAACVIGREDIIKKIEEYIFNGDKDVPLMLLGDPGLGKSSVMCKVAEQLTQRAKNGQLKRSDGRSWHVFYHFVGAIPGSTIVEPLLKRLLRSMDFITDSNIPKDVNAAAQQVCSMLSNPNTQPLIVMVDAINQFSEDQASKIMSWVPRKLSPFVRIIFSSVSGCTQHVTLMKRETKPIELQITPLDMNTRKAIVANMLTKYGKKLSNGQLDRLLAHPSSENPLWLTIACEQLCQYRSGNATADRINSLPEGVQNLLEEVLKRFESDSGGLLLVATLCLLEASAAGLDESELRRLLADEDQLMPPGAFDEKDEKETSEKETKSSSTVLSEAKWSRVFKTLQPYIRPYGDSCLGRMDIYHRTVSNAVRQRYFQKKVAVVDENIEEEEDVPTAADWWHKKLADFFEEQSHEHMDRYVEEYPHQLMCLEDKTRLAAALCDWRVFDVLYNEEYSSYLLIFWRKVGSASDMISNYESALTVFEEDENVNEEAVSIRYEKVCRVVIQAGKYHEALELLKTALKIEEKELGARAHRMVELYALMAEIYDEKLKLNDFVSPSQLPDLRKTIHYGRKSIAIRRTLPGAYHRSKLGMSLMKLAFNMESWQACGGGPELSQADALAEGNKYIDKAIKIFQELNDDGHYAEALMTKGVLAPRGCMEQLKLYNDAMDLAMQMYGEYHILTSRLYINIGIVYEDNNNYNKAYEYFKKWARVSEEILGPDHPKTLRAKGVLRESRYKSIARRLGEAVDDVNEEEDNEEGDAEEDAEAVDIEHYDDQVGPSSNQRLIMENSLIQENGEMSTVNSDPALIHGLGSSDDIEVNGYYDEDEDQDSESGSDRENSDNENFYDDNFEDYDEQYMIYSDTGALVNLSNVNVLQTSDDEDDDEIIQMAARENARGPDVDNRYASDSHESSGTESDGDDTTNQPNASNQRQARHN